MPGGVVIVGGGIVGSFVAWFLKREGYAGAVRVIERDSSYRFASTTLAVAGIRTQFACAFNTRMSLFGATMFREIRGWFGPDAEIGFREQGYLIVGPPRAGDAMRAAAAAQNALGARIDVLDAAAARARFPWLETGDLGTASFGLANEGWIDGWSLLQLVRHAARRLGVEYVEAEATGFDRRGERITGVRITGPGIATEPATTLRCDWCVNAAGAASGRVAALLGIDLPVEPRKRTVFHVKAPVDGRDFPMLFDDSGVWARPEGEGFLAGVAPDPADDPPADGDFEPQHALLEDVVWPRLAHRIPAFERLRLLRAWAGHYEFNTLDQNGVIGPHDELANLVFATGFSGHGLMHAPATGRALAEWIVHGGFRTLDLSALGYARIRRREPIVEHVVY
ncbi:MAG: NAD(P)/FAD-dependent oxidoreductase [Lautropia sp.]